MICVCTVCLQMFAMCEFMKFVHVFRLPLIVLLWLLIVIVQQVSEVANVKSCRVVAFPFHKELLFSAVVVWIACDKISTGAMGYPHDFAICN